MNEKLLKIAHKQQNLEYLKKQNITSPHQLQELRNQIPGEYTSQILEQSHESPYRHIQVFIYIVQYTCLYHTFDHRSSSA